MQILRTKRAKTILGTAIGAPLGIGGVALAAAFVFGSFGGQTGFVDATASLTITNVTASGGRGGVTCEDVKKTGDQSFEVNPKAQRLILQGQSTVTPGDCVVLIDITNTGDVPVTPGVKATQVPAGWTFEKNGESKPTTIAAKGTGQLILQVTATDGATAGGIAGQLTGDTAAAADPGKN